MTETRVIKRYANRKLYDTQHSRYVTLEQISEMIRNGDDVKIIDNKTKEDLTSVTLAQIIFEEEKKQRSFLSLQTMRDIIQNGGESLSNLVTEAQKRVSSILPLRRDEGDAEGDFDGGEDAESIAVESATTEVAVPDPAGSKAMLSLREFREWVQQAQSTIEEWQKRVDGRIRDMVEGISPFSGLQKDVQGLGERIAELEAKLAQLADAENRSQSGADAESAEPQPESG